MEHFPYIFKVAQLPSALRYEKSVPRAVFTTDANGFIDFLKKIRKETIEHHR